MPRRVKRVPPPSRIEYVELGGGGEEWATKRALLEVLRRRKMALLAASATDFFEAMTGETVLPYQRTVIDRVANAAAVRAPAILSTVVGIRKGDMLEFFDAGATGPIRASLLETLRRRELALLLASHAPMADRHKAERDELQAGWDAACLEAVNATRRPKAKRKTDPVKAREAMGKEAVEDLLASGWSARADELIERHIGEKKAIEKRAREIAAELRPRPGPLRVRLSDVWVMSYATQGLGAKSYARARAETDADRYRAAGVLVEVTFRPTAFEAEREGVERHGRSFGYVDTCGAFAVEVFVESELDAEIVRRAPSPSLREQVRLMWARGVNPRVYMPYLPHGFEEREGLDYFGNDLRAKGTAT